jgi:predicted dehydrogenase
MVGHTFIYHPVINDLKRLIDSGELGEIYSINFEFVNLGKFQQLGVLWDLLPHGVSIILYLLNNPEIKKIEVNGIAAIHADLIDNAYLTLYFKKGGFSTIHVSWLNPCKERKLTVVGSKQMAIFDDISPLESLRIYNKGVSKDKSFSSWGDSIVGYRHGNIISPVTSTGEPLKLELQHFVDCVINNKKPLTDGSRGADIVKIIEDAVEKLNANK